MKLFFCSQCQDVLKFGHNKMRYCKCGNSGGEYIDNLNGKIFGNAIPIGINNYSFVEALRKRPQSGKGKTFTAFVIPIECNTIEK